MTLLTYYMYANLYIILFWTLYKLLLHNEQRFVLNRMFLLLSFLALAMRGLIAVFPEKAVTTDPALLAAVTAAVSAVYPGSKITRIEDQR